MKLQHKLVGMGLLGVAVSSSALNLGRARGNVVLGQPLSLAVEVRVDEPDDAAARCFRVDVFHGDAALDASRVRLVVQTPTEGARDAILRIRSDAVVNEPVVGVVLHALCGQTGRRRYEFLPEFPADLSASTAPVALPSVAPLAAPSAVSAPAVASVPAVVDATPPPQPAPPSRAAPPPAPPPPARSAPAQRTSAAAQGPAATARAAGSAASARAVPAAPKAPRPERSKAVAAPVAGAAVAGGARLTLGSANGSVDGMQPTPALQSSPIDDAAQREAVAAMWRALRTTPEEVVRDRQRLEALEAQQAAWSKQPAQASDAERELRLRLERAEQRLDEAERGRVDVLFVYALLGLLTLAILLAARLWQRARANDGGKPAWSGAAVAHGAAAALDSGVEGAPSRNAALPKGALAEEFQDSDPSSLSGARTHGGRADAAAAAVFTHDKPITIDASRPVRPDEFFDVQQHADFFVSLGQYEQAIDVLKQHLDAHQDMSPLGFLDLLGIYHQLGRKDDYDALRTRFERRFSAHIPNFAAFTDEGLGLEDYPATMLVIQSAWGDVRVLDTIEAHLMRLANDTGRPLDLAAYRDLLMLYGVAQDVFVPAGTTRPATGWTPFSGAAPLGAAAAVAPPMRNPVAAPEVAPMAAPDLALDLVPDSLPSALEPMGGPAGLDLDIDLSTVPAPVQPALPRSQGIVDIDLPLLDDVVLPTGSGASPVLAERAPAAPEPDSGLIDFDLFDPNTEARIAPKSNR